MVAVIFVVLFAGEYFLPEDCYNLTPNPVEAKYSGQTYKYCRLDSKNDSTGYMRTGRRFSYSGEENEDLYSKFAHDVLI